MVACPFSVPRYEWDKAVPSVRKCDMCIDRLLEGKKPACADACQYDATVAGTREELLVEAHKRIAESPDEYYDHVYGENELGGTNVLFLDAQAHRGALPAGRSTATSRCRCGPPASSRRSRASRSAGAPR